MHDRQAILAMLPATRRQIRERFRMSESAADRITEQLITTGRMHIGGWSVAKSADEHKAAIYHAGPGEPVPRPKYKKAVRTPEQNAKRYAQIRAKKAQAAPPPPPNPYAGRYIPPQHPLIVAFFGGCVGEGDGA